MIQGFSKLRQLEARRGVAALLLAAILNLALVPCTMALEVVEDAHDCCPPELKLEPSDCCELDEVSIDVRGAAKFDADELEALPLSEPFGANSVATVLWRAAVDPPDPPELRPDLNALFCVYLN